MRLRLAAFALGAAVFARQSPSFAQVDARAYFGTVAPVAPPQTLAFGAGAQWTVAVDARPLPWLALGAGVSVAVTSLVAPRLPEGIAAPSGPGGWFAFDAIARVEPFPSPGRVSPFLDCSLSAGLTGTRFAPSLHPRVGALVRVGEWSLGASVGYWRLFDVIPSVLPGDGQFVSAGLELTRAFVRPPPVSPRRPPPPPPPPRCPERPRVLPSDLDHDGCPDPDTDGDGIADPVDRCVTDPEDLDNFEDEDGCPEPDNDRDNLPDTADRCPNAAEVINGVDDEDGCPDETFARVESGRVEYVDRLRFFFNSVRLTPESEPVLRDIATLLAAHPEYATVYVEGHADAIGDEHYNFRLSWQRARAIVDELAQRGIPRSRFVAVGYGQRAPVAYGNDYWRRALNRRVEFVLDGRRTPGRMFSEHGYATIEPGANP
jgi:outer membrane protein OmpA-like peptidoglycan-associated protein